MSDCVICLDDLINVENGSIVALQCGHVLHQTCLASMVMNSNDSKCPICRLSIQGVLPLFLGSGSHSTRSEDDKEAAAVFCQTANAIFAQTTGLDVLQQECRVCLLDCFVIDGVGTEEVSGTCGAQGAAISRQDRFLGKRIE